MRILDIRETAIPLKSELKNSSFDFSEMTTSVVAVITDVVRDGDDVTIVAFGRMVHVASEAADQLAGQGVSCEVIDPRTTSPLDEETILESIERTGF